MRKTLHQYYESDERTVCRICEKKFEHLGSHIWHKHKLKANDYKSRYGLSKSLSLISEQVERKKHLHFKKNREKYTKNLFSASSLKSRFKKGSSQHRYVARRTLEIATKNLMNTNKGLELCPVCNMKFNHLDSHLFNKHQLMRVPKKFQDNKRAK